MAHRSQPEYSLGHSAHERRRLKLQAAWYEPITLRTFRDAGIREGMRVLDVGCGVGDVSFAVRKLVGASGEVAGIDRSEVAVAEATERADAAGLTNVKFSVADCDSFFSQQKFDAIVGRLVLMYQTDPVRTLKQLSGSLQPTGIVVFIEADYHTGFCTYPETRLHRRIARLVTETFTRSGADVRMGIKLCQTFVAAGLPAPSLHMDILAGGGSRFEGYEMLAEIVRSVLPSMEKFGLATAQEIAIDSLAELLRAEVVETGATVLWISFVEAWTRRA
jgi:ubiquinone/menaquinone biosynthesis C-methylase UbiE